MKIKIITTGGTIGGIENELEENEPRDFDSKIGGFIDDANLSFEYLIEKALNKDSRFITLKDRELLAQKIQSSENDKILITHGTITMVETAKFLGKLNLDNTIVLVGSFILGTETKTDAPFNLGYAICALQTLGRGVYIAMNGKIFSWNNVVKNTTDSRFEYLTN